MKNLHQTAYGFFACVTIALVIMILGGNSLNSITGYTTTDNQTDYAFNEDTTGGVNLALFFQLVHYF